MKTRKQAPCFALQWMDAVELQTGTREAREIRTLVADLVATRQMSIKYSMPYPARLAMH